MPALLEPRHIDRRDPRLVEQAREHAAVHLDGGAVDHVGLAGAEEDHRHADLLRFARPADRHVAEVLLFALLVPEHEVAKVVRHRRTEREGVHADLRPPLLGQGLGEMIHPRLRGAVGDEGR